MLSGQATKQIVRLPLGVRKNLIARCEKLKYQDRCGETGQITGPWGKTATLPP